MEKRKEIYSVFLPLFEKWQWACDVKYLKSGTRFVLQLEVFKGQVIGRDPKPCYYRYNSLSFDQINGPGFIFAF